MEKFGRLPRVPPAQPKPKSKKRPATVQNKIDLKSSQKLPPVTVTDNNNATAAARKSMFERLATPRKDSLRLPDRPSVYWLDYLIDPTPHLIKNPEELASYYEGFEPKFPRTRLLSAPRKFFYVTEEEEIENRSRPPTSQSGIAVSALTYNATDRIKELSRPKTATTSSPLKISEETTPNKMKLRPSTAGLSLPPISDAGDAPCSLNDKAPSDETIQNAADLGHGDFSRSKCSFPQISSGVGKNGRVRIGTATSGIKGPRPQVRSSLSMRMPFK